MHTLSNFLRFYRLQPLFQKSWNILENAIKPICDLSIILILYLKIYIFLMFSLTTSNIFYEYCLSNLNRIWWQQMFFMITISEFHDNKCYHFSFIYFCICCWWKSGWCVLSLPLKILFVSPKTSWIIKWPDYFWNLSLNYFHTFPGWDFFFHF